MASLELEARLDNLLSTAQAETADIDLFAPITEREECPICLLPLPLVAVENTFFPCCGKRVCNGCIFRNTSNDKEKGVPRNEVKCAFCRRPAIHDNYIKPLKKLMKKNDPDAYVQMACLYRDGEGGVMQSNTRALEMSIKAAELDHAPAFGMIGQYYYQGGTTVEVDMSKALAFFEVAAKKGFVPAHYLLTKFHRRNGNIQQLMEHMKVAASAGDKGSMNGLMEAYKDKLVSKEDLTRTLRAHQASQDEMKSKDRDEAHAAVANGLFW